MQVLMRIFCFKIVTVFVVFFPRNIWNLCHWGQLNSFFHHKEKFMFLNFFLRGTTLHHTWRVHRLDDPVRYDIANVALPWTFSVLLFYNIGRYYSLNMFRHMKNLFHYEHVRFYNFRHFWILCEFIMHVSNNVCFSFTVSISDVRFRNDTVSVIQYHFLLRGGLPNDAKLMWQK